MSFSNFHSDMGTDSPKGIAGLGPIITSAKWSCQAAMQLRWLIRGDIEKQAKEPPVLQAQMGSCGSPPPYKKTVPICKNMGSTARQNLPHVVGMAQDSQIIQGLGLKWPCVGNSSTL